MPRGSKLRFPKTIPKGDIGVEPFGIGRRGREGGSCGVLPHTVSFVFHLSFFYFLFLFSFVAFPRLP